MVKIPVKINQSSEHPIYKVGREDIAFYERNRRKLNTNST